VQDVQKHVNKLNKKNLANAKGNAQQRCMSESPVRPKSKLTHPSNDVSFTLARGFQTARPVLFSCTGLKSQIFPTPSHLSPLLGVTPFKFMKKLYGSRQPTMKY